MLSITVLFVSSLFGLSYSVVDQVVRTAQGDVSGWERASRLGRTYQAWTGIPFAQPPVGNLRFQPPAPPKSWQGVFDATKDAKECLQNAFLKIEGQEDCLYLSVYRPKINKERLPVIFYVHGGGFTTGNMGPRENADYLMDEDVVLVTTHYRLNGFGFMSLSNEVLPGNMGLKDQIAALKWVRENIAAFGGNPDSVTVIGESAGGFSSHFLLKTPATNGLVHRAVSDSGSFGLAMSSVDGTKVRNTALSVAEQLNCDSGSDQEIVECLQRVDANALMNVIVNNTIGIWPPVVEQPTWKGAVLTADLYQSSSSKPWITSVCMDEWVLLKQHKDSDTVVQASKNLTKFLQNTVEGKRSGLSPADKAKYVDELKRIYFLPLTSNLDLLSERIARMSADYVFLYPAIENLLKHDGPKWMFRLEHVGEISEFEAQMFGITKEVVVHANQRRYYFNNRSLFKNARKTERPQDFLVSLRMVKYLVNFANHNDPTPEQLPNEWYQFGDGKILRILSDVDTIMDKSLYRNVKRIYELWHNILVK